MSEEQVSFLQALCMDQATTQEHLDRWLIPALRGVDYGEIANVIVKLRAELAAAQQRIAALEAALSERVAIDDTNRTLAEDWKRMRRAARAAEQRGFGVEWWGENSDSFGLLEANIMDRLTRPLPEPPGGEE